MAGVIRDVNNPVVFFDIKMGIENILLACTYCVGGYPAGRIKMELFADVCPKV